MTDTIRAGDVKPGVRLLLSFPRRTAARVLRVEPIGARIVRLHFGRYYHAVDRDAICQVAEREPTE